LGAAAEGFVADLSSLAEVRRLAGEVLEATGQLHVLVNNAGIYMERRVLTPDGLETTFAVNHVAPFLLTNLLLPRLRQSAPSRIVTVASVAHRSGYLEWDNLNGEEAYDGYSAYAMSKLCNILFTYELAERLRGTGVTANCLHPGVVDTKLLQAGFPGQGGLSVREGARLPVHLASSPEVEGVTGEYFAAGQPQRSAGLTYDGPIRRRLWELSCRLTGLADDSSAPRQLEGGARLPE
jgi:NAD(P)-dependent dehydrogenase (short-subunit alcohol dehydrogenase family)